MSNQIIETAEATPIGEQILNTVAECRHFLFSPTPPSLSGVVESFSRAAFINPARLELIDEDDLASLGSDVLRLYLEQQQREAARNRLAYLALTYNGMNFSATSQSPPWLIRKQTYSYGFDEWLDKGTVPRAEGRLHIPTGGDWAEGILYLRAPHSPRKKRYMITPYNSTAVRLELDADS